MASLQAQAFATSFQLSPIMLVGGVAQNIPGGMLPIVSITQSLAFVTGLLSGSDIDSFDEYLMQWLPLPGTSLIQQKIGEYTFANQSTAANAVIRDPNNIYMLMIVNSSEGAGYLTKLASITALVTTLQQHNNSGGLYTIATPSYIFQNCVMLDIVDSSRADIKQWQNAWRITFRQPLVSLADAQAAQNNLMSQISSQSPTTGSGTGIQPTTGQPSTLATPSFAPSATSLPAASQSGSALGIIQSGQGFSIQP